MFALLGAIFYIGVILWKGSKEDSTVSSCVKAVALIFFLAEAVYWLSVLICQPFMDKYSSEFIGTIVLLSVMLITLCVIFISSLISSIKTHKQIEEYYKKKENEKF